MLAFQLLGASTKRDDTTKIGFFGSGNKYAIARLLKQNIFFKIYSGLNEIKFDKKPVVFRDGSYEMITINGQDTSMTTDMGPTWEDWFVIREFYCNALDEGEAKISVTDTITPEEGKTVIFIEKTPELSSFFKDLDKFILVDSSKVIATESTTYGAVSILTAYPNEFICYRKGIRINTQNGKKSLYRYNFDRITINESRVAMYEHEINERIASFFAVTNDITIIKNYLKNWKGTQEEQAAFQYVWVNLSQAWHEVLKGHRVYPEKYAMVSGDFEAKLNSVIVPNGLAQLIAKSFPDINVVGYSKQEKYNEIPMTSQQQEIVTMARDNLADLGYNIQCKIVLADFYEGDVIGMYDDTKKQIVLSNTHFTDNQSTLQNTLLEEYFHSRGQLDGRRTFVTFLIDELLAAKKIQYGKTSN